MNTRGDVFKSNAAESCCRVHGRPCAAVSASHTLTVICQEIPLQCLRQFGHYCSRRSINFCFPSRLNTSELEARCNYFPRGCRVTLRHLVGGAFFPAPRAKRRRQGRGRAVGRGGKGGWNAASFLPVIESPNKWLFFCGINLVKHFLRTTEKHHLLFVYECSPLFFFTFFPRLFI